MKWSFQHGDKASFATLSDRRAQTRQFIQGGDKMLYKKFSYFLALAALLAATLAGIRAQSVSPSHPSIPIGAAYIALNSSHVNPSESSVIRAFVPTGSVNPKCLATLGDSNFAQAGNVIYCVPREPSGLGKGVVAVIFFPGIPPNDLVANITIFQEGALHYGTPVLCNVEGC
ncbi:MAG: hypothetical protein DMG35_21395 [Acidobacteria bacterium]|nr:MAG: hypothetical protein DMG35_21395 [Acidobacteriota bacterium]